MFILLKELNFTHTHIQLVLITTHRLQNIRDKTYYTDSDDKVYWSNQFPDLVKTTPVFLPGEYQGQGAWWAAVYGVTQSRTRLKRLSRVRYAQFVRNHQTAIQSGRTSLHPHQQLRRVPVAPYSCQHLVLSVFWILTILISVGFPGGSEVKASACKAGDPGSIPRSGRSAGEGNGNPLQYSCLENPMDRRAWQVTVHGVGKSRT